MHNIQKLIQNLITQQIILENDIQSVSISCDENGCLKIVYDPTGEILFNSCESVVGALGPVGPAGFIVNGATGPVKLGATGLIGNTGQIGLNGLDGDIGVKGSTGATGPQGTSTPGQQPPPAADGVDGVDATDILNYQHLKLLKTSNSALVNFSPSITTEYNIEYTNIIYSVPTSAQLYSTSTRQIKAQYGGIYRIEASINIELDQTSITPATYYLQLRFQDGLTSALSTWESYGPLIQLDTTSNGIYMVQLYHSDTLELVAGEIFYAKYYLITPAGVSGNIIQRLDSGGVLTKPYTNRDSELTLDMVSA